MKITDYKLALISGASAGIGEEFARQLHAAGLRVCLVARRGDRLARLCHELNAQRADSTEFIECDLCDFDSSQGIIKVVEYIKLNNVDLLVNNAGRGSFGHFEEIDFESEQQMVQLNIMATMRLAHAVIAPMKDRRFGAIISVSSIAGIQALPYMATYAATKAFNLLHSLGLREELRSFNIRVLAVCPGPTATEFGGVARVPGTVSAIHRDSVALVVRNSIKALENNRAIIISSWRSKLLAIPSLLLPRALTTYFVGRSLGKVLQISQSRSSD